MNEYQFIYWYGEIRPDIDKASVIKAKSLKAACGKFIRARSKLKANLCIDYEVFNITTNKYVEIFDIKSVKEFVR